MQLNQARVLLTGASGGLGQAIARQLDAGGASLLLAGRDAARLQALQAALGERVAVVCADLTTPEGIAETARVAREAGVNVLINNAGASAFGLLENQQWSAIDTVLATSLEAPIQLTHALLPGLRTQPSAAIVNVGSTFGALPFAGFAAYSAAKAGLRAFSQALRRELADTQVAVLYVSPRVIRTPMNSAAVNALNSALNTPSDSPEAVAQQLIRALIGERAETQIGFPERLFAWINGFAPGLIDRALRSKLALIKHHAPAKTLP